jgi:hypothetical protein
LSPFHGPVFLAPPGSSGNVTGSSVRVHPGAQKLAFLLAIEAAGATPALSWRVQGSMDGDQASDAAANWVDLALITAASDSVAAIPIVVNPAPAGTSSVAWLSGGGATSANRAPSRFVRRVRVITSATVNMTGYRVELTQHL